jgi:hypothetical protein
MERLLSGTRGIRRRLCTRAEAMEFAAHLHDRSVPAEVVWNPRLASYVCNVTPPWYEGAAPLRSWDDVFCLLQELYYTGAWSDVDVVDDEQGNGGGGGLPADLEDGRDVAG